MKFTRKTLIAGAAAAAIAGGGLLSFAGAAHAAGALSWEPDGNAAPPYGYINFYNSLGQQITGGSNLANLFQYAVATTANDGGTIGNLTIANPQHGVLPANWPNLAEGNGTHDNTLTTGPANIVADAATNPVWSAGTLPANLNTWLTQTTPDTTAGFANIAQIRIQDSGGSGGNLGGSTYWETDIAYNNTSASITVDGVVVPANSWTELFPAGVASSVVASLSPSGASQLTGTSMTLSAAVTAPSTAGTVQFFDNGAAFGSPVTVTGGNAALPPFAATDGTHSYTASFIPTINVSGPNTAGASEVVGSTSAAVPLTVHPPQIGTTTALTASSSSIAFGGSDTLTANITEADAPVTTGLAGSVQFFVGGTTSLGVVSANDGTAGEYKLTTTALPQGSPDSVTAVFTPTSNSYGTSTSAPVTITVAAPAKCSVTGSSCTDTQNIQVTMNPGSITITTPYTATNPFVLPDLTESADGSYFESQAAFPATANPANQQIVVTSTLSGDPGWTLSVAATNLTDASSDTINASGLGLTSGALLSSSTFPGTVSFTDNPAHNPSPLAADHDTNTGLATGTSYTFATTPAGDGTAVMDGTLTLLAPTNTPAGTYTGTLTFSVS